MANAFGNILGREIVAQQVPRERWKNTLQEVGFTDDAASNLIAMTEAVIEGKAKPEGKGLNPVTLKTTLGHYLKENIK